MATRLPIASRMKVPQRGQTEVRLLPALRAIGALGHRAAIRARFSPRRALAASDIGRSQDAFVVGATNAFNSAAILASEGFVDANIMWPDSEIADLHVHSACAGAAHK
jgi:hypothetical protein